MSVHFVEVSDFFPICFKFYLYRNATVCLRYLFVTEFSFLVSALQKISADFTVK